MISLSYQNKDLGETRIETGKSYIYKGKNPDGSEVPVESVQVKIETPVPTPTAQASPEASGFGMVLGIIGVLAMWLRLKK